MILQLSAAGITCIDEGTARMDEENINWRRMRFKKHKVWLATDSSGSPHQKKRKGPDQVPDQAALPILG